VTSADFWDSFLQGLSMAVMGALAVFLFYNIATHLRIWRESHLILLSSLLLRIFLIYAQQIHPFLPFKRDPLSYDSFGTELVHGSSFQAVVFASNTWGGFNDIGQVAHVVDTAFFMAIFGAYPHVLPIINSFVILVAALLCLDIIQKSSLVEGARWWAGVLFATSVFFYPGCLLTSLYNARDLIVGFAFVLAVHGLLTQKRFSSAEFIIGAVIFVGLRLTNIVFISSMMFVFYLVWSPPEKRLRAFTIAGVVGAFALGLALVFKSSILQLLSVDFLTSVAQHQMDTGDRMYPIKVDVSTLSGFAAYIPVKLFYFLYYPFPWEPPGAQKQQYIDTIYTLGITPLFFYSWFVAWGQSRRQVINAATGKLFLFCMFAGMICMGGLSLVSPTPGATVRYRIPFVYLLNTGMALALAAAFVRTAPAPAGSRGTMKLADDLQR
jgi:hypothetical protein